MIYQCQACGATTDTEKTKQALSNLYSSGTRFVISAPSQCPNCGSTHIIAIGASAEASVQRPVIETENRPVSIPKLLLKFYWVLFKLGTGVAVGVIIAEIATQILISINAPTIVIVVVSLGIVLAACVLTWKLFGKLKKS